MNQFLRVEVSGTNEGGEGPKSDGNDLIYYQFCAHSTSIHTKHTHVHTHIKH